MEDLRKRIHEFKEECLALMENPRRDCHLHLSKYHHQQQKHLASIHVVADESSDNISTSNASIIGKEELESGNAEQMEQTVIRLTKESHQETNLATVAAQLYELAELATKLRLRLSSPVDRLHDPLFEVLKFLPRKQIAHYVHLTSHHLRAIVIGHEEHWPKFKFGRFVLSTDEDLKRTTKFWMFKNRVELKAPPEELASIIGALDIKFGMDNKKIANPVQLVSHYSEATDSAQPKSLYLFINMDDLDTEDNNEDEEIFEMMAFSTKRPQRVFVHLTNKLATKIAMATAIYWFRQLTKVHFISIHFEQYRWTHRFSEFLTEYSIPKFFPMTADTFKTYNPVSIQFLWSSIHSKACTLWDMHGNYEFLRYLTEGKQVAANGNAHKRLPESFRVWGFVPQSIPDDLVYDGETNFFDALIHCARNNKKPELIVNRIDLNFKQNPSQWPKIISGMRLIYKCRTFKVDEEDGTESETVEMRYRLQNQNGPKKFEIRMECGSDMVEQQMYSFALILEEEEQEEGE